MEVKVLGKPWRVVVEEEIAWAQHDGHFCPVCEGRGTVYVPADPWHAEPPDEVLCLHCNGWGVVDEEGEAFPSAAELRDEEEYHVG